jgi:hypothetical protein
VRRAWVVLATVSLAAVAAGAVGLGLWNLDAARAFDQQTDTIDDQIATVRGEIDELNED